MLTIFKREFKSYFTSPIGFAILVIFYFFSGLFFSEYFQYGMADLSGVFSTMFIFVLLILPVLPMRLFSEDRRQKTDQLLFTSPVRLASIVMGKFMAALAVYALALAMMLVYQIIVSFYITPDWMVFVGNWVGVFLFGMAFIAIGMFFSALTEIQVVAAVCTFGVEFLLIMLDFAASNYLSTDNWFGKWLYKALAWISISQRYNSFTQGTMDYSNIIFFASIAFVFVFFTVMLIDRRRYA